MHRNLRTIVLQGVILGSILAVLGVRWGIPRVEAVSPAEDSVGVPANAEVRVTFSRSLEPDTAENSLSFEPAIQGSIRWEGKELIFKPAQDWPAGAIIRVRFQAGPKAKPPLSLAVTQSFEWSFKVRQHSLVYLYPASKPANLYLFDLSSNEAIPLIEDTQGLLSYDVSEDGAIIYYSVRQQGGSAIYRLPVLRGQNLSPDPDAGISVSQQPTPEQVLNCEQALCSALALSPGGHYLAYERSALPEAGQPGIPQVWIVSLDPQRKGPPSLVGEPDHQTTMPEWSKNNWLAVYDLNVMAYLFVEPGVGERTRFQNQTGQVGAWHPSGNAFLAPEIKYLDANFSPALTELEPLADSHLILFDLQTGSIQDLTPAQGVEDALPVYSPDGKFLVFARKYLDPQRWTPGRQIWVASSESREARPLTDQPVYNHYQFAWSPTGEQLAYVRFNQTSMAEPPEIWLIDLLTGEEKQIVIGGYLPQWIP